MFINDISDRTAGGHVDRKSGVKTGLNVGSGGITVLTVQLLISALARMRAESC